MELVASAEILVEYRRVGERLHRKYPSIDIDAVLDLVTYEAFMVLPPSLPVTACDDADDVKFLACALAGGAHHVVSGDKALLRASGFRGVAVITPREFVREQLRR